MKINQTHSAIIVASAIFINLVHNPERNVCSFKEIVWKEAVYKWASGSNNAYNVLHSNDFNYLQTSLLHFQTAW